MQSQFVTEVAELDPELTGARGDSISYRQVFENTAEAVPLAEALVVTAMPRGSLQIMQPPRVPEVLLKNYQREMHLHDALTWQAILRGQAVRASDVFDHGTHNRYVNDLMRASGFAFAAAAPLREPLLRGFPGAIHAYRTQEQGDFTDAELRKLHEAARHLDQLLDRVHEARHLTEHDTLALTSRPQSSIFVFNGRGDELFAPDELKSIDSRVREQLMEHVQRRLSGGNGRLAESDRLQLPDSRGDLWTFRIVSYERYPALGEGKVVIVTLQPSCKEWSAVRPTDFAADPELARLLPAMKFMQQEFSRGPTLGAISKHVHLSPFHFHRRFTELLGLTPKHFLLECQVAQAKAQLMARRKELAEIAADCGFAHQSHFTSRFKQATGLTPTRWRRLASESLPKRRA